MLRPFREHLLQILIPRVIHKSFKVLEKSIFILIQKTNNAISNIPRIMRNPKIDLVLHILISGLQLSRRIMMMSLQLFVHRLQKQLIGHLLRSHLRRVIHNRQNPLVRGLHQVTNNLIIEKIDILPLDSLPVVLFLFLLQYQLCSKKISSK